MISSIFPFLNSSRFKLFSSTIKNFRQISLFFSSFPTKARISGYGDKCYGNYLLQLNVYVLLFNSFLCDSLQARTCESLGTNFVYHLSMYLLRQPCIQVANTQDNVITQPMQLSYAYHFVYLSILGSVLYFPSYSFVLKNCIIIYTGRYLMNYSSVLF